MKGLLFQSICLDAKKIFTIKLDDDNDIDNNSKNSGMLTILKIKTPIPCYRTISDGYVRRLAKIR